MRKTNTEKLAEWQADPEGMAEKRAIWLDELTEPTQCGRPKNHGSCKDSNCRLAVKSRWCPARGKHRKAKRIRKDKIAFANRQIAKYQRRIEKGLL